MIDITDSDDSGTELRPSAPARNSSKPSHQLSRDSPVKSYRRIPKAKPRQSSEDDGEPLSPPASASTPIAPTAQTRARPRPRPRPRSPQNKKNPTLLAPVAPALARRTNHNEDDSDATSRTALRLRLAPRTSPGAPDAPTDSNFFVLSAGVKRRKPLVKTYSVSSDGDSGLPQSQNKSSKATPSNRKPRLESDSSDSPPELPVLILTSSDESDKGEQSKDTARSTPILLSPKAKPKRTIARREITPPPPLRSRSIPLAYPQAKPISPSVPKIDLPSAKSPSPTIVDSDDLETDPDLLRIRQQVRARLRAKGGASDANKEASTGHKIDMTIQLIHDDSAGADQAASWSRRVVQQVGLRESMEGLYNIAALTAQVPASAVTLVYEGRRVYRTATPQSLHIYGAATLQAYRSEHFERTQSDGAFRQASTNATPAQTKPEISSQSDSQQDADEDNHLRLTVRSKGAEEIGLRLKKTDTVSALIRSYLKRTHQDASKAAQCRLIFDGEALPAADEIGSTEVEDGEKLDLVIG
ncbi:hypothetical protein E5Q_03107 [Mixia osmundae IAM 14324]|uniref:Ubiquitin-like domain-containing protein n=1 Tax=Mixia osmundae (strain CBS 9802 / IAM 14324 / JCM 22182 / KY 12970) TaxID=764103 RepID=G7E0T1_MIXOS|nr:hypothetical protein E5Q_03107 [Mixia osmundae IAM 14324]